MTQDIAGRRPGGHGPSSLDADRDDLDIIPETAGPHLATTSGGAIYSLLQPGSQTSKASVHMASVILTPVRVVLVGPASRAPVTYEMEPGAICVVPVNAEVRAIWSTPAEVVTVAVRPGSLHELAASAFDADDISLEPPPCGTIDREALWMARLLKSELTPPGEPNEIFVDSLIKLVGIHLLRNYATLTKRAPAGTGRLSARDTRAVRAFLKENFSRKLSVDQMAEFTGYSKFHFIRAFRETFGQSPHQYVLELRLSFAEDLLKEGTLPIAEIAYLSGFSNQSHLTAVMRKNRGVTPATFRSRAWPSR